MCEREGDVGNRATSRRRPGRLDEPYFRAVERGEPKKWLARAVAADAVAAGRSVRRVAVKVRVAPYFTSTKIRTLPAATTDPDEIAATARGLLTKFEPLRPVRLLGVRGEYER